MSDPRIYITEYLLIDGRYEVSARRSYGNGGSIGPWHIHVHCSMPRQRAHEQEVIAAVFGDTRDWTLYDDVDVVRICASLLGILVTYDGTIEQARDAVREATIIEGVRIRQGTPP